MKQVLENPKVRTLSNELGGLHLKRGKARKTTASVGVGNITSVLIPSQLGVLGYALTDRGFDSAYFFFGGAKENGKIPPGHLKHLPEKYRDLPGNEEAILFIGPDGDPVLSRPSSPSSSAQTLERKDGYTTTDVPDALQFVERYNVFVKTIGGCNVYDDYQHRFGGLSVDLNRFTNAIGVGSLTALITYLLEGTVIASGILASAPVSLPALAGILAGALIAQFGNTTSYTVGVRDFDFDYLAGTATGFVGAAALEYNAPASETLPNSSPYPTHPLRAVV